MVYVLDTSSLIVFKNYYPATFPSLWSHISDLIKAEQLISVKEVFRELDGELDSDYVRDWAKTNASIFKTPSPEELAFVSRIFTVRHFQALISMKSILKGSPVADPFVIAAAKIRGGTVVTQESQKPNAAKIPNVCEHFGIECIKLQDLMNRERWEF